MPFVTCWRAADTRTVRGLSLESMVDMVLDDKYGLITSCQAREDWRLRRMGGCHGRLSQEAVSCQSLNADHPVRDSDTT